MFLFHCQKSKNRNHVIFFRKKNFKGKKKVYYKICYVVLVLGIVCMFLKVCQILDKLRVENKYEKLSEMKERKKNKEMKIT